MFAIGAVIAFIIALILNIVDKSGNSASHVLDFALVGGAFVGLHLLFGTRVWGPGA